MKRLALVISFIFVANCSFAQEDQKFSGKLEEDSIQMVCSAVSSWQIDNFSNVKHKKAGWTNGALYIGMFHWADSQNDSTVFNFLKGVGKDLDWGLLSRSYHADDICVGQMYIEMYKKYGKDKMVQPVKERAFYVASHPSDAVLSKRDKIGKNTRWSWCDALFMAPPVYAALYTMTGEKVYRDYLMSEFKACTDSLYDHSESLYYRDGLRIGLKEANGAKQFWGRGNGWVFGGIPLVLNNLPADDPERPYFEEIFKEMAESVVRTQDKEGHWHASLLDPGSYPDPENSASAFFCYGLAWGINNGILDGTKYKKALKKGWNGLVEGVHPDGKLGFVQPVGAAPKKVSFDSTDVYGVGAFLLAGTEILKMLE